MNARRISRTYAAAIVALLLAARSVHAVPARELQVRAEEAAQHGQWNDAARSLEEMVSAGIDSNDVIYNLGTVYAQAGRFGEGIWRLEQVTRRTPFASDAQQNLHAARIRLAHRDAGRSGRAVVETATPWSIALAEVLPLDWAVSLTLLCELSAIGGWLLFRRRGRSEIARVSSSAAAIVFAFASVFFGSVVVARMFDPSSAVVLHDGLRLLHDPSPDAIAETSVREGERVETVRRSGTFVWVRSPSGAQGWLASRHLGALDD